MSTKYTFLDSDFSDLSPGNLNLNAQKTLPFPKILSFFGRVIFSETHMWFAISFSSLLPFLLLSLPPSLSHSLALTQNCFLHHMLHFFQFLNAPCPSIASPLLFPTPNALPYPTFYTVNCLTVFTAQHVLPQGCLS